MNRNSYQNYLSLVDDEVITLSENDNSDQAVGYESPTSRYVLSIKAHPSYSIHGPASEEIVRVQISLTVSQFGQIVLAYFRGLIRERTWARPFFRKLMIKRWAVMTHPHYLSPDADQTGYDALHYGRIMADL